MLFAIRQEDQQQRIEIRTERAQIKQHHSTI